MGQSAFISLNCLGNMQNNTQFKYRVEVLFNSSSTPRKVYPCKTKRAAEKLARAASNHPLFVSARIFTPIGTVGTLTKE